MEKAKKAKRQKRQAEGKEKKAVTAKTIKQPKERRTFIGSLINADLWQRMKMLSLKEGKAAGKLLDNAMGILEEEGRESGKFPYPMKRAD